MSVSLDDGCQNDVTIEGDIFLSERALKKTEQLSIDKKLIKDKRMKEQHKLFPAASYPVYHVSVLTNVHSVRKVQLYSSYFSNVNGRRREERKDERSGDPQLHLFSLSANPTIKITSCIEGIRLYPFKAVHVMPAPRSHLF